MALVSPAYYDDSGTVDPSDDVDYKALSNAGTWMIGQFSEEANTPGRPLHDSYAVYPYPRLWVRDASFVSGHAWVVPKRERRPRHYGFEARLIYERGT